MKKKQKNYKNYNRKFAGDLIENNIILDLSLGKKDLGKNKINTTYLKVNEWFSDYFSY